MALFNKLLNYKFDNWDLYCYAGLTSAASESFLLRNVQLNERAMSVTDFAENAIEVQVKSIFVEENQIPEEFRL